MKEQIADSKQDLKPSEEAQLALNALVRASEKVEKEEAEATEWAEWKIRRDILSNLEVIQFVQGFDDDYQSEELMRDDTRLAILRAIAEQKSA